MNNDNREYVCYVSGHENKEMLDKALSLIKKIDGVEKAELIADEAKIKYKITEWASDYDIYVEIINIADSLNVSIDHDDDNSELLEAKEESVTAETEDAEAVDEEIKTQVIKAKKGMAEWAERSIQLGVGVLFLIASVIFNSNTTLTLMLGVISFALASYDIIEGAWDDIKGKNYLSSNAFILVIGMLLFYLSQPVDACIVVIVYSLAKIVPVYVRHVKGIRLREMEFRKAEIEESIEALKTQEETADFTRAEMYQMSLELSDELEQIKLKQKIFNKDQVDFANSYDALAKKSKLILTVIGLALAFMLPITSDSGYLNGFIESLYLTASFLALAWSVDFKSVIEDSTLLIKLKAFNGGIYIDNSNSVINIGSEENVYFDVDNVLTQKVELVDTLKNIDFAEDKIVKALLKDTNDSLFACVSQNCSGNGVQAEELETSEGLGVKGFVDSEQYFIGRLRFLKLNGIDVEIPEDEESQELLEKVYLANNKGVLVTYVLKYTLKQDSKGVVAELKEDLDVNSSLLSGASNSLLTNIKQALSIKRAIFGASKKYKQIKLKETGLYVGGSDENTNGIPNSVTLNAKEPNCEFSGVKIKSGEIRSVPNLIRLCNDCLSLLIAWSKFYTLLQVIFSVASFVLFFAFPNMAFIKYLVVLIQLPIIGLQLLPLIDKK